MYAIRSYYELIAAVAFAIGLPGLAILLASIGLAGGVLALLIMIARSMSNVFLRNNFV